MQDAQHTFFSEVVLAAEEAGGLPDEVLLLKPGEWKTPNHGNFKVTPAHIDAYIQNYNELHAGVYDLPMNYDHNRNLAGGWISSLFKKGEELWGKVGWTPSAQRHLVEKGYRYLSPEFWPKGWTNPLNASDVRDNVLVGCALTNKPLFKGVLKEVLQPLSADDGTNNTIYIKGGDMDLEKVRVKKPEELNEDEKKFLDEHKADLTDDERTTFGIQVETPKDEPKDQPQDQPQDSPKDEPTKASDGVQISASEYAELQAAAQKGVEASEKLLRTEMQGKVDAAVSRGAIKSDEATKTVDMLVAASDEQRSGMVEFIAKLPDNKVMAGELGDSQGAEVSASDELANRAANSVKESNGKLTYADAMKGILATDSGLRERVDAERAGK